MFKTGLMPLEIFGFELHQILCIKRHFINILHRNDSNSHEMRSHCTNISFCRKPKTAPLDFGGLLGQSVMLQVESGMFTTSVGKGLQYATIS